MPKPGQPSPPSKATGSDEDRYLTATEVAQRLRTTPITIVRLCREGKIPATKPAGTWLISEAELQAHIDARRNEPRVA